MSDPIDRIHLCSTEEILQSGRRLFEIGSGIQVVLFKTESGIVAVENRCPHAGGSLDNGLLDGNHLRCVWHGWRFDLSNGECIDHESSALRRFPLEIIDDQIFLRPIAMGVIAYGYPTKHSIPYPTLPILLFQKSLKDSGNTL